MNPWLVVAFLSVVSALEVIALVQALRIRRGVSSIKRHLDELERRGAQQDFALAGALAVGDVRWPAEDREHPFALFLDHQAGQHTTPHPACIHRDCLRSSGEEPPNLTRP